ncbi:hypothetical protein [Propionivibrio dicarboxylicus]|uniref:Phage-related protein n=1 Tax=Propionivibrio dicarboxylicus TaxID=83767 RepID=A0A1G8LED3_9RHOO|nr:hypothetical protein [Propionivibrio dicarboxylicus]SDI54054.1 hypothetical protein SAMN05660652_03615 [Propionivibrio dicarboxylicus]
MPTFPTLSRLPDFPLSPDGEPSKDGIISSPMTAGYQVTRPRFTRDQRSWGVNYKRMSRADLDLLRAFRTTTLKNGALSFEWLHPLDGVVYTVRLESGHITFNAVAPNAWQVAFTLVEV